MKLKNIEKDEKNLVTLTIEVDADEFEKAIATAFKRDAGRYNVPGFRKGKATRKMIETLYGTGVFYESAVNLSFPDAFDQAADENGLETVEKPDIEVTDIGAEGYTFVARVHVYPEAEVGEYKGLHAYKPPVELGEAEVDAELTRLQERNARMVTVSRPIEKNDTATIDFEGYIDDIPFEGGKGENFQLEIGSGRFIPGFEDQLIGHAAGEDCSVKVTFPEQYQAPELAGREAVFAVKIHEIKERELPALDDEFAKDVSDFDTIDKLRDDIREKLEKHMAEHSEEMYENALAEQIFAVTKVAVPETMVSEQQSTLLQNMMHNLSAQGLDFSTYLQITGKTAEEIKDDMLDRAQRQMTIQFAYEKIAALEGLEVSDEELQAEYAKVAEQYKMPLERVQAAIPEQSLKRDLLRLKASQFVKENAFADANKPEEVIIPQKEMTEEPEKKSQSSESEE